MFYVILQRFNIQLADNTGLYRVTDRDEAAGVFQNSKRVKSLSEDEYINLLDEVNKLETYINKYNIYAYCEHETYHIANMIHNTLGCTTKISDINFDTY